MFGKRKSQNLKSYFRYFMEKKSWNMKHRFKYGFSIVLCKFYDFKLKSYSETLKEIQVGKQLIHSWHESLFQGQQFKLKGSVPMEKGYIAQ